MENESNPWIQVKADGSNIPDGDLKIYDAKSDKHNVRLRKPVSGTFLQKMHIADELTHFKLIN